MLLCIDDQPAGCGGYRANNTTTGEIKRLYIRPAHRGQGHGRRTPHCVGRSRSRSGRRLPAARNRCPQ
ncbi:MAG: GNAT family N-acetyltransferase [Pseudonocardiaceae bacterium]